MTILLVATIGVVALIPASLAVAVIWQARNVQREVPLAITPPPRSERVAGSRLPGPALTLAALGESFAAGYGATRPRETPGVLTAVALVPPGETARTAAAVRIRRSVLLGPGTPGGSRSH